MSVDHHCRSGLSPNALIFCTLLTIPGSPSLAAEALDDSIPETPRAESSAVPLQAITVTARRNAERAKDLPFTVTRFGGQELEERRLLSLQELLWQVPGVEISDNGGDAWNALVRIRGVGALQRVSGEDTSVGLSVDGVPLLTSNMSSLGFDLERVEVLKGPQGTMFGSNSEAGAINVITAKPTRTFEGYARTEIGTQKQYLAEGAISGPLSDTVSARLALRGVASNHWIRDARTGGPLSEPRDTGVRGTLLWQPQPRSSIMLSAQHDSLRRHPNIFIPRPYDATPSMDRGLLYRDALNADYRNVDRVSAVVEHDFDAMRLTSVSGYSKADAWSAYVTYEGGTYSRLLGMVPDNAGYYIMPSTEKSLSQELRLSSRPDAPIFWVAGLSWLRYQRHVDMRFGAFDHFYPDSTLNADTLRYLETTSRAIFGEVTVPVAQNLKLTAGLRHTWDRKHYQASWQAVPGNGRPIRYAQDSDALRESYTTGRLALSYALDAQTNLYAVASRGYKSRGYNDGGTNLMDGGKDLPYDAARVVNLELGVKHESADGRLGINAAIFHAKVRGDHVMAFDAYTFAGQVENLDTRSRGFELSGFWKPAPGWTLDAALAYTDARITGVPAASQAGVRVGNRVPDSPRWSGNLAVQQRLPLSSFLGWESPVLSTRLNLRFAGNRAVDPQNNFNLSGYYQIDLRAGISSGNTELYVWAKNLNNKHYDLAGGYFPSMYEGGQDVQVGLPARGRTVGIGFAHYF